MGCIDWVWSFGNFLCVVSNIASDVYLHLFEHRVNFLCDGYVYDDNLDDIHNQMCEELRLRDTLLPAQGIVYSTAVYDPFVVGVGDLTEVQYYLNEVITEEQELYLIMRITDGSHSRFFIYRPIDRYLVYADTPRERQGANCAETAFVIGIAIYKLALSTCLKTKVNSIRPVTQQNTTKTVYEEFVHVQGHIRNLPAGYKPSGDALNIAKNLGLKIESNQTYVNSFERGVSVREHTVGHEYRPMPVNLNELIRKHEECWAEIDKYRNVGLFVD